ncbi:MAG: hypothetical protein RIR11_4775 [Bacteroidota bacterium]
MDINFKEIAETFVLKEKIILDKIPNFAAEIPAFTSVSVAELNKESVKKLGAVDVLYFFKIINGDEGTTQKIRSQIQAIKDNKETDYKLPLVNKESNDDILYVGKSSGKFSTRLNQHLFKDSKSTYALHLQNWEKNELKLELHYTSVDLSKYDEGDKKVFLEKLETVLHAHLKPILGRTGH